MKYIIGFICLFLSLPNQAIDIDVTPDECESPSACILKINDVLDRNSSPGRYPSLDEQAVIKKLLEFGEEAMPFIVQLLEDDEELIARIGAVALTEAKSINEKYLPQIIKGLDKDVSWLAPALAKVGTPEAAEVAVKKYLISNSAPHNQEANALKLFGEKSLPAILKAAKCDFGCNDKTYYLLGYVLGEMENARVNAAKSLIKIVEDSSLSKEIRQGVLYMISFLNEPALLIEDKLLKIKESEFQLIDAVDNALIGIKSKHSGKIYADRLVQGADILILRDIAELGIKANNAGLKVLRLLDSNNMETRLFAARTLGFIEYIQAAPMLIQLLNESSDVQLNWVAAESLGRMKAELALPMLKDAAEKHWYPPVRDAANKAIAHIESGQTYQTKFHKSNFAFDYFDFQHMDLKSCENISLKAMSEPEDQKLYVSHAKEKLESLSYESVILGYGANDEEEQKSADPDGIIEVNESNIEEHREEIKQVPQVALRVTDGWLAGSNRGEWGGELVFIPDNGKAITILNDNIEDVYKLGDRYIATSGLAHLTMNNGIIYQLSQDENGYWSTIEWLKLPGSPRLSWFVETGELLINTSGGGSILLSKDGSMRMATCK